MADLYDENNLRVVRLQIVDEITGEPLDYVNVRTNAASVNFSNGEFLEDAFRALVKSVNTLKVDTAKQRNDFDDHVLHGGHVISERIDNAIIDTKWNQKTGVITFYRYDGTSYEWDTGLEKIPMTIDFDKTTNEIVFALDGGGETRVDISKLVDIFKGVETSHTKTTVSKDNQIQVDIKDDGIQKSYLDKEIRDILDDSVRFNEAYEDKIKGIEEGANKYILPTATDKILGGIKIGKNINIDSDGAITAGNVLYGESRDTAEPVNLFLQVDSIGGPSTDPIPTMEDATSYIVTDGNIINFMSTDATYEFITTTDGSVESGLSKDQVEAKFYPGIELVNKADLTWYNDGIYNYAVTGSGDGFIYQKNAWVFVDYILTDAFIDLLNSGTLVDGLWEPPTDPDDGGTESGGDAPTEGDNTGEESGSDAEGGGTESGGSTEDSGETGSEESGGTEESGSDAEGGGTEDSSETENGGTGESSGGTESGGTDTEESDNTESGGTEETGGESEGTGSEESSEDTPTEGDNTGEESGSDAEGGGTEETGGTEESGDNTGTETGGTESGDTESGNDTPSTGEETGETGTGESGTETGEESGGTESGGSTEESGSESGGDTPPAEEETGGTEESGGESSGTESGGSESGNETGSDTPSTGDSTGEESGGTGSEESGGTESGGESGSTESGGDSSGETTGEESGGTGESSGSESGGTESGGESSATEEEEEQEDQPVDVGPGGTNPDDPSVTEEEEEQEDTPVDVGPGGTNPDDPSVTEEEEVESEDQPVDVGQL